MGFHSGSLTWVFATAGVVGVAVAAGFLLHRNSALPPHTVTRLEVLPYDGCRVACISRDGDIIGGSCDYRVPFLWSRRQGIQRIDDLPRHERAGAAGVLDDGTVFGYYSTMVGNREVFHGFVRSPKRGMRLLAEHDGSGMNFQPLAATPDGRLLVGAVSGSGGQRGATWDAQRGVRVLEPADSHMVSTFPRSVSDDGTIIGGSGQVGTDMAAIRWVYGKAGVCTRPTGPGIQWSAVASVSADGKRMAISQGNGAYLWDDGKLVAICKPDLPKAPEPTPSKSGVTPAQFPPFDIAVTNAISGDGRVVVGVHQTGAHAEVLTPFLWTEDGGVRALDGLVGSAGIRLPAGFVLAEADAVSRDGRVIAGTAAHGLVFRPYVLTMK